MKNEKIRKGMEAETTERVAQNEIEKRDKQNG